MTLAEAELIFDSWREAPPAHHLLQVLARLWGWKPPPAELAPAQAGAEPAPSRGLSPRASAHSTRGSRERADTADARQVLTVPGIVEKPAGEGLPAVMLDFEALKRSYR